MSLLSNNNTIHLYNRWISPWYENNTTYSNLLYSDLYIHEFINGIYYQLKMPSSILTVKELNLNQLVLHLNLYVFRKRKQKRSSLFFNGKVSFFSNFKKINYILHKVLFLKIQYLNNFKYFLFLCYLYNTKYYINNIKSSSIIKIKNIKVIRNNILFHNKQNKILKKNGFLLNLKFRNNYLYIYFLSNLYIMQFIFNFLNIIKNKLCFFYIDKYFLFLNFNKKYYYFLLKFKNKIISTYYYINCRVQKNKNSRNYKNILLFNKKASDTIIFNKLIKKKKKLRLLKMRIYRNIVKNNKNINKKKYINRIKNHKFISKLYLKLFPINNRKKINLFKKKNLTRYKYILRIMKNKLRNKKKKFFKKKVFFKKIKFKKRKYKQITNRLAKKNVKIKKKIFIDTTKNKKRNKKKELYYRKKRKKISEKFNKNLRYYNINSLIFFWIYRKLILWYSLFFIKMLLINTIYFLEINKIFLHFKNYIFNYLFFKNKIITLSETNTISLILSINKNKKKYNIVWFNRFYLRLMLCNLRLKIINTLSIYLDKHVLFFPYYKKKMFSFKDVKLVSDFIKLKLQYGNSIVKIMKKIIKVHMNQRYKLRIRNKRYKLKMIIFKKKINKRLRIRNKNLYTRKYLLIGRNKYDKKINRYNLKFNKILINNKKGFCLDKLGLGSFFNSLNNYSYSNNNKLKYKNNTNSINLKLQYKLVKMKRVDLIYKKKKLFFFLKKWKKKMKFLNYKHYPLIGIRIECNGPSKKGRRTRMVTYNEWVDYYKLPGKMPYSTKMADLHYWQSFARTKVASIGIKIWFFFHTILKSVSYKKIEKNIKYKL